MDERNCFYRLKEEVLVQYKAHYPFFDGTWKTFSSEDIRNLIEKIEESTGKSLSEKWIYTHLKPSENEKLPRKDTLNILSEFSGFSSWDEFVFKQQSSKGNTKRSGKTWMTAVLIASVVLGVIFVLVNIRKKDNRQQVELKNEYTGKPLETDQVSVYKIENEEKIPVEVTNSTVEIGEKDKKIIIESPFFETKEVENPVGQKQILVKPDDYAMVLKTFIESDLKDWKTRRNQLEKILSDDLEVILLFENDMGAEYMNKEEFSAKLTVPTSETKKWKILQLETNNNKQVAFIRIRKT